MTEQIITLFYQQENKKWIVSYHDDNDITYDNYQDALHSIGILAKEILRVFQAPVKIQFFNEMQDLKKQSFLYPQNYIYYSNLAVKNSFSQHLYD